MNEETIKMVVSDVMSDFYIEVIKDRFDNIEKRFDNIDLQLTDLRLTTHSPGENSGLCTPGG